MAKLRSEVDDGASGDEDNEAGWAGWDVESNSSDESESSGWMNVDSDGDGELDISDSEDEAGAKLQVKEKPKEAVEGEEVSEDHVDPVARVSTLATTKVFLICSMHST
jgi:protein SDA1